MKKQLLMKTFLVAVSMLVGTSVAWADITETVVVNCDFNNGETLFTGASRITVTNDNNAKFICAKNSQNGYSLATYDFSSAIGNDASAVKIEFAFWIPNANAAYRRYFTVGQASLRTGFGTQSFSTTGSMFSFGLARISSANYFSINGASTTAAASAGSVLGTWAHAEIYVDHSTKKVNYKITSIDGETTYYNANNVAFVDGTASYCNQLDFFDCQNNTVSYLDNLVITKYVDNSKTATTYTVKYQNAGGTDLKDPVVYDTYVGDTYTATALDMATFYSNDTNKKYIYTSGNTSTAATSTASNNVITLVFNEYNKVAYTITAKNGEETLELLASGDAYTDGSTSVYWNKFKNYNDKWYETTGDYGKTITEAGNTDVAYTLSSIDNFFEMENLTRSGGAYLTEESTSYSNHSRIRLSKGSLYYTPALASGIYTITIPWENANNTENEVYVYTRASNGTLSEKLITFTAPKGSGTFTGLIDVPDGYSIALNGNEGSNNNNARMDYMTLTSVAPVSATIPTSGYGTIASAYPLDCANLPDGLKAYQVTELTKEAVTLEEVTEAVAAGTGLILKGTAGESYNIPVAATGTDISATNKLQAAVTATAVEANETYILQGGQFHKVTAASTIPAGKAYLRYADLSMARELTLTFGDATGIGATLKNKEKENKEVYNLKGQRVAAPQKGLYIQNGKKVIVK